MGAVFVFIVFIPQLDLILAFLASFRFFRYIACYESFLKASFITLCQRLRGVILVAIVFKPLFALSLAILASFRTALPWARHAQVNFHRDNVGRNQDLNQIFNHK